MDEIVDTDRIANADAELDEYPEDDDFSDEENNLDQE